MTDFLNLDPETIRKNLDTQRLGLEIICLDSTTSTNDVAKKHFYEGSGEGLVILAGAQTQGRGRLGRTWASEPGLGIYLSVLLKPELEAEHIPGLTLMAGVATLEAIKDFGQIMPTLKWPNDILLNHKKLAGVLCEFCSGGAGGNGVIIGIGVNVNHELSHLPPEIKETATSMKIENGMPTEIGPLAASLIEWLDREYDAYLKSDGASAVTRWSESCAMFGTPVSVTHGPTVVNGVATGLDPQGRLMVETDEGRVLSFDSGEVTLKIP